MDKEREQYLTNLYYTDREKYLIEVYKDSRANSFNDGIPDEMLKFGLLVSNLMIEASYCGPDTFSKPGEMPNDLSSAIVLLNGFFNYIYTDLLYARYTIEEMHKLDGTNK